MIESSLSKIIGGYMAPDEGVRAQVAIVRVSEIRIFRAPQAEVGQDAFINSGGRIGIGGACDLVREATTVLRLRAKYALPGFDRRNCNIGREAVILAQPFIIHKEKGLILHNRTANGSPELIAVE